jgi:tRNA(Ile)-lysidine synthase
MLCAGDTVVVGVSGGADSLCLLHVLLRLAPEAGIALHVGHLHHGIRGAEADADAAFVAEICAAWGVPYTIERADVPALAHRAGLSLEEAARQARYAFLGDLARRLGGHTVAVAHHGDDQVETVLMHLIRGAGLAGLRGMAPVSRLDELRLPTPAETPPEPIRLIRPLLAVSRAEIDAYVAELGVTPRFDRSNLDTTYFRNRLRHELIPLLESYNPNIRAVVQRTATALAGDYELLREQAAAAWEQAVRSATDEAVIYDLAALRALPEALQRSVLREGIHRLRFSLRNVGWLHVEDALAAVRQGHAGAAATLPAGLLLTLGYYRAVLAAAGYTPPDDAPQLAGGQAAESLDLGSGWEVAVRELAPADLPPGWDAAGPGLGPHLPTATVYLDADQLHGPLALRPRRPGDRFQPLGMAGHQTVRAYMINVRLPANLRAAWPLLVCGEAIVWIVGGRMDSRFAVTAATRRVVAVTLQRAGAAS